MSIPSTMKAVVLHGADDMRLEGLPVPEPGPGEVLLKVEVASICGTDVKVLHRKLLGQPEGPFIMGHEYAGTVAKLGPGVDEFRVGDRVAVEVHKGCERCENCIKGWYTSCLNYGNLAKGHRAKGLTCDGGFAEYAVNHINTLYRLPASLTFEQACMVTTAASPLWAIDLMGGYMAGETVLVLGPGPIGLMAVQLCKAMGAERAQAFSHHHQALDVLGEGLVPVAWSDDGLLEAVEREEGWVLGLQWHAEATAAADPAQQAVFDTLVAEATVGAR